MEFCNTPSVFQSLTPNSMKSNLYLISLSVLGLSLISCGQDEKIENTGSKNNNVYEEAFVKVFGDYTRINNWNTAKQFSLDIIPGNNRKVRIYAPCRDSYRLVAYYSDARETFTSRFDAPVTAARFVVALGDDLYYAMPDGQVSAQSPRADDAKVSNEVMQWILAIENDFDADAKAKRGAGGFGKIDFDFNDLLIGIRSLVIDDEVSVDFLPLACGDNQPFYIHVRTDESDMLLWQADNGVSDDCEFHQWFGIHDYTKGVNTGINSPDQTADHASIQSVEAIGAAMTGCHIMLPSYWSLSNYSHIAYNYRGELTEVWGLYITVGTFKGFDVIKDNADYAIIGSEGAGAPPHMLLFPDTGQMGEWRWPCEGNNIGMCYPAFMDWAGNNGTYEQYMAWHEWLFANGVTRDRY